MTNEYGLDVHYFKKKLAQLVRDADHYRPEEMAQALHILKEVAEKSNSVKNQCPTAAFGNDTRH